jgi:hypothetical protein
MRSRCFIAATVLMALLCVHVSAKTHWSFVPVKRPALPMTKTDGWARNAIDAFVLAKLEAHGLRPSPQADRQTLIRRLSLDLTGLPSTPKEVDAFVSDTSPSAYENLVDRLFASPAYGERMTLDWLDAARFADTHGYQRDGGRDMTAWRDWVIKAFNDNMPFDRFTVEQLAGDLIPNATIEQKIASGFNRNHMINVETGAVPEEYLAAYIIDRVNTTGTVWLGLTVGCAQCHNHKYDPISQTEYYQLYAFFNHVPENGIDGAKGNAVPLLKFTGADGKERTAMVMQEMEKLRDTTILLRGEYDQHGAKVTPGVPAFLQAMPNDVSANRLSLAKWLVDPANPLTARVAVNRYWQSLFGTGIVKSSEDFGTQGEPPSHPELLDWLASDFREHGWDVKRLMKQIVMSATYQQASTISRGALASDPECRLLGRFPRKRLAAEALRDQVLALSGLLDHRIGGASVSPYQPDGIWEEMTSRLDSKQFTAQSYEQSHGPDLYRRSMYTFRKRTIPPPAMYTLDAPDRETCVVRRTTTNTPLQALVLMNDPTFVEASRKLAERVMKDGGSSSGERLRYLFRAVTARTPRAEEVTMLKRVYEEQASHDRSAGSDAAKLLAVGESPCDAKLVASEVAAWTIVAQIVLNLDETLTKN